VCSTSTLRLCSTSTSIDRSCSLCVCVHQIEMHQRFVRLTGGAKPATVPPAVVGGSDIKAGDINAESVGEVKAISPLDGSASVKFGGQAKLVQIPLRELYRADTRVFPAVGNPGDTLGFAVRRPWDGRTSEIAVLCNGKVLESFLYRPSWLPAHEYGAQTSAAREAGACRHGQLLASYGASVRQHLGRDGVARLVRHLAALQVVRVCVCVACVRACLRTCLSACVRACFSNKITTRRVERWMRRRIHAQQ
jgi:hypothetical protein